MEHIDGNTWLLLWCCGLAVVVTTVKHIVNWYERTVNTTTVFVPIVIEEEGTMEEVLARMSTAEFNHAVAKVNKVMNTQLNQAGVYDEV